MARNELPRISETPTYNPWKLTVTVPNRLRYSEARGILEDLDRIDRRLPEVITFGDNPNCSWMFAYQGELTALQRSAVTYQSFSGNQLILNVSGVTANSDTVVLAKGDIIQVAGFPYPFTSTTTVTRGSGTTVLVTTHRPNIFSTQPVSGTNILFGNDVSFRVFCPNMPTYKLIPGGAIVRNGVIINNAVIEFSDNFIFYEQVALA